ncbi:MAG: bifunctional acetate--CoA ligase family protein/GNAT family N-acetyltransferase [Caldimonas sp.]
MTTAHLERLLLPRSVAVIGASDVPGSIGSAVLQNLYAGSFAGPIFAVNPHHARLQGKEVFASVMELPAAPDLALLCTAPSTIPELVADLARLGTRAAIVTTTGLSADQGLSMSAHARAHGLRLLGPNSIGLLSPYTRLNASFANSDALPGNLAFVSQSGAIVTAVMGWARSRKIGFSHIVSLGEQCDVDAADLLDFLAGDPGTRSILLYIESIGEARKFMSAARAASRNKPVIVVKAGRAGHGIGAAMAHTGGSAGSDDVFEAAIRRAGMLRVDTLQDLLVAAETLTRFRDTGNDRLTLVGNGGGAGVIAADFAAHCGISLSELGDDLRGKLEAVLPPGRCAVNPIDIVGDAPVDRYVKTLQALVADRDSGTLLFVQSPTAVVSSTDIASACAPVLRQAAGRVMTCWLGDASNADARRISEEAGIADYATPEDAIRALAMLANYRRNRVLLTEAPTSSESGVPDLALVRATIQAALDDDRDVLNEFESKTVLEAYGIPVVPTASVGCSPDEVVTAAGRIAFPVALKILSRDIVDKTGVGGVRLGIGDETSLRKAVEEVTARVREAQPRARIDGFTVQAMLQRPMAHELIIAASVDPTFGPILVFGHGGTAVDALTDRAVALPPLNRVLARDLIARTRVAKLLIGYCGHPPARLDAICDVLIALSQMLADLPELTELQINPLWADDCGAIALDARLQVTRTPSVGTERFAIQPYPAELTETVRWKDKVVRLRPIRPDDEWRHEAFLQRMDAEDLRMRFFSVFRLQRNQLARLVQIDYAREMAFVAVVATVDGDEEILGVVRAVADADNVEAEFAIAVRSDLKGQGLGGMLTDKMVSYLRSRGIRRLVADTLHENHRMRELARNHDFKKVESLDTSCLRFSLDLR